MPGGDKTGPDSEGPRTGRQMGICKKEENEKDEQKLPIDRGRGRGRGRRLGRGRRRNSED